MTSTGKSVQMLARAASSDACSGRGVSKIPVKSQGQLFFTGRPQGSTQLKMLHVQSLAFWRSRSVPSSEFFFSSSVNSSFHRLPSPPLLRTNNPVAVTCTASNCELTPAPLTPAPLGANCFPPTGDLQEPSATSVKKLFSERNSARHMPLQSAAGPAGTAGGNSAVESLPTSRGQDADTSASGGFSPAALAAYAQAMAAAAAQQPQLQPAGAALDVQPPSVGGGAAAAPGAGEEVFAPQSAGAARTQSSGSSATSMG